MIRTVTALRERGRGKVEVELDGAPWRVLSTNCVVRAEVRTGRPLDRETARRLAQEVRREKALARATRTLAAGDRTRGELEERLARVGVPSAARAEAMDALAASGVVDDERLAATRAQTLARRGYGDAAIRADLVRRRVPSEFAAAAIAALEPELDRARHVLETRGTEAAVVRRLSARGFTRDTLEELATTFARDE